MSSDCSALTMWYAQPAAEWEQALPVGNGRLGAMVFGGPAAERIQLNEDTIWTGGPYDAAKDGAHEALPEIRSLIFAGKWREAHKLFGEKMLGEPYRMQKYQPLGNLTLALPGHEEFTDYRRELDLSTAVASVRYRVGVTTYRREVFSSPVDQVVAVRLTADSPGAISLTAALTGGEDGEVHEDETYEYETAGDDELVLRGRTMSYRDIEGKVRYEARVKVLAEGGTTAVADGAVVVTGADAVTLLVAAGTNFVSYNDLSADPAARVAETMAAVVGKPYLNLRADAVAEHARLFGRVAVDLEATAFSTRPTDERMKLYGSGRDPQLAGLLYQFGRYLLVTGSRPGTQPENLQGIWSGRMNPAWDGKFTTNINLEMNYWPAEAGNLAECVEPLVEMVKGLAVTGAKVAKAHYNAGGWVFHQNADIWLSAVPMDGPLWGTFATAGAWLCTHLWEHYVYGGDKKYLAEIYPLLTGSAAFFLDTLVEHPEKGWLVTCPSSSPESFPGYPGNGRFYEETRGYYCPGTTICAGSTIDMQILRDLFGACVAASEILGKDDALRAQWTETRERLAPMQVGCRGQLQEWLGDWVDIEHQHRHVSHLYGVYPSDQITPETTPELAAAAAVTLDERGDGTTGFSMTWKAAAWARLYNGERAHRCLTLHINERIFPNAFSACANQPQVDGTFGYSAAVAEMLLQSHGGVIRLLPGVPAAWATGSFRGLRARGGVDVSLKWADGAATGCWLTATRDATFKLRAPVGQKVAGVTCGDQAVTAPVDDAGEATITIPAGQTFEVAFEAVECIHPATPSLPEIRGTNVPNGLPLQADFAWSEFAARREKIFDVIGEEGMAVLQGDTDEATSEPWRQSNDFYYVCGIEVPRVYLVLNGADRTTTLYLSRRDTSRSGMGPGLAFEDAHLIRRVTGIDAVRETSDLLGDVRRGKVIYTFTTPSGTRMMTRWVRRGMSAALTTDPWDGRFSHPRQFVALLQSRAPGAEFRSITPVIEELRGMKSPREIELLRQAGYLSALGVIEAMRATRPGMVEWHLQALMDYVFISHGARGQGYRTIAASGKNVWYGHYGDNNCVMRDGDWVLMDGAPDVGYYTSDIGRMWPVNGKYADWQRELYGFVVEYHKAILKRIKPGVTCEWISADTVKEMAELVEEWPFSSNLFRRSGRNMLTFRGHISHAVGMAVHDVGPHRLPGRPLEPGMVFSIDPQLRVTDDKLYVRCEDTIVVTEDGYENFTAAAPLELDDVEALMKEESRFPDYLAQK